MKRAIKAIMSLTPYRIVRRAQNRFEAFDYTLSLLSTLGYRPKLIIDGGAHLGEFAKLAAKIFPDADVHLVEPQPECHDRLQGMTGRFHLHPFALGSPEDVDRGLRLTGGGAPDTGAYISNEGRPVHASTLDALMSIGPEDRAFLKMDLQGFELQALKGAERSLRSIEVILTEVSFFRQAYEPPIIELMAFLDDRDFELFDVAALSGRTRDNRLRQGDFVFVKRGSPISADTKWS